MEEKIIPHHHQALSKQDFMRMMVKRRWAVLAVFIIVAGTVTFQTLTMVPIYQATVQILIERQIPRILQEPGSEASESFGDEFYLTQYKLLEGRSLVKKVVDKLNLKKNPQYAAMFNFSPTDTDEMKQLAEEELMASIARGIKVTPVRGSSLVNVSFSNPDPKFAAALVNCLAQCYIEQSLDLRFAASQEATTWLKGKLTDARSKLEESEAKLNQYKREQNIVTVEDKESITSDRLGQLNRDLIAAQTHRMEVETRYNEVIHGHPIAQVLDNPMISVLRAQEAKLVAEQSEDAKKYGEGHPRMLQLSNELGATRAKINTAMSQVKQTIINEYNMAKAQEDNLKAALNVTKVASQDLGDRAIQYRVLLRDVETNRALYENVLKTLKTISATENVPSTNIRIVDPAIVPRTPISPRTSRNLTMGMVMGLGLGLLLAFGLETLDTTLKIPEELEKWLGFPNLAMIPHVSFPAGQEEDASAALFVHHGFEPMVSECYRALRSSILFSIPGHAPRILLVTSSLPSEGKTVTTANLATVMAKAEPQVLVVDADLRRPALHRLFNVSKEPGLSSFLVGETDELPFVPTLIPNLFIIPSGPVPPNPSELLGSTRMEEFLRRAQEQFGLVILDSSPIMSVTDAAILSTKVEGVLLVIKAEAVPRKAAMDAVGQLQEFKAPILGTVLNNVPIHRDGYYYNYYVYRYRYYNYYADKDSSKGSRTPVKSAGHLSPMAWVKKRLDEFKNKFS
ncbi:MAG: GumC family protein [Desulfobaccales bacterium]